MQRHAILFFVLVPGMLASWFLTGCRDHPHDPAPCRTEILTGGVDDNFATVNTEQASPSPSLMNYMLANYHNPFLLHQFDQTSVNRPVGHTFQLTGVEAAHPVVVKRAIFTMRVKAKQGSAVDNDWFHLLDDDAYGNARELYDVSLVALNGGSWYPWKVLMVTLDLGELGLLDELSNGVLHMYLQDDTAVDFMKLEVEYCGECGDDDPSRGDV